MPKFCLLSKINFANIYFASYYLLHNVIDLLCALSLPVCYLADLIPKYSKPLSKFKMAQSCQAMAWVRQILRLDQTKSWLNTWIVHPSLWESPTTSPLLARSRLTRKSAFTHSGGYLLKSEE